MAPPRRVASLRNLERDWCELDGLELEPGGQYLLALTLLRKPGNVELAELTGRMRQLVDELKREMRIKARCVLLTPGERIQVFRLDEHKPKPRRRRRRDDDDET